MLTSNYYKKTQYSIINWGVAVAQNNQKVSKTFSPQFIMIDGSTKTFNVKITYGVLNLRVESSSFGDDELKYNCYIKIEGSDPNLKVELKSGSRKFDPKNTTVEDVLNGNCTTLCQTVYFGNVEKTKRETYPKSNDTTLIIPEYIRSVYFTYTVP